MAGTAFPSYPGRKLSSLQRLRNSLLRTSRPARILQVHRARANPEKLNLALPGLRSIVPPRNNLAMWRRNVACLFTTHDYSRDF